jgi:agmatine deiminase
VLSVIVSPGFQDILSVQQIRQAEVRVTTPQAQGYSMPPEWAPHERCWMAWPCRAETWGERMAAARRTCAEIAQAIAQFEPVTVIARPELTAEASLRCGRGVSVVTLEHDDAWMRDLAPAFVFAADGALAGIDWRFDGYGGRLPGCEADARVAAALCERLQIPRIEVSVVVEGGAIHIDGEGTCLASVASLLDPARNPGLDRGQMEDTLRRHLGVEKVIWLEGVLAGDRAGGHVEQVARFSAPGTVLALTAKEADEANHQALRDNVERLKAERDAKGRELEVIEIEQPAPRQHADGRRIAASYLNFYLANGAVIMPMFDDSADRAAYRAIAAAFADREMVEIEASDLIYGGGGIHSITREQPARPGG